MEENRQIIQVINQGPPIAQVHLEKLLFERFYRADAARSSHASGLGLSIVRAIMTLHGGEARAQCLSQQPGAQIVFSLIFPKRSCSK